ncbi:MAG: hypothetical protein ACKO22_05605 [Cyanobium sp.]
MLSPGELCCSPWVRAPPWRFSRAGPSGCCCRSCCWCAWALNALDGIFAREFHQATPSGAVLNELGDGLADAALCLPLALVPGKDPLLLSLTWCWG